MSGKKKAVMLTLFGNRPEVGEFKLHPLTAGRIALLEERGNVIFGGGLKEGDAVPSFDVFEAFMVAALDSGELAELSVSGEEDWKIAVKAFGFDLPDETLMEFWQVVEDERAAITAARAVPKKKRARKRSRG